MSVATRFVKDKGTGPEQLHSPRLIQIENDFYSKMAEKVFFSGDDRAVPESLRKTLNEYSKSFYISKYIDEVYLSENLIYIYDIDPFIGNKSSFIYDTEISTESRTTISFRITFRASACNQNTAVVIFHYAWEYSTPDKMHFREDGECTQTWVLNSENWQLLAEYLSAVCVEPVAKIL